MKTDTAIKNSMEPPNMVAYCNKTKQSVIVNLNQSFFTMISKNSLLSIEPTQPIKAAKTKCYGVMTLRYVI